ncbi:MAG: hypothetical protein V1663_02365 [archaeon]
MENTSILNIRFGEDWLKDFGGIQSNLDFISNYLNKGNVRWSEDKIEDLLSKYIFLSQSIPRAENMKHSNFSNLYYASKRITTYPHVLNKSFTQVLRIIKNKINFESIKNKIKLHDHIKLVMNTKDYDSIYIVLIEFILQYEQYPTHKNLLDNGFREFYKFISDRTPLKLNNVSKEALQRLVNWSLDNKFILEDLSKLNKSPLIDFKILLKERKKYKKENILEFLHFLYTEGNCGIHKLRRKGKYINRNLVKQLELGGFIEFTYSGAKITKKGAKILSSYNLIPYNIISSNCWYIREELQDIASRKRFLNYQSLLVFLSKFKEPISIRKVCIELKINYNLFKNYTYQELENCDYLKIFTPKKKILTKKGKLAVGILNDLEPTNNPLSFNLLSKSIKTKKFFRSTLIKSKALHYVSNYIFSDLYKNYLTIYLEDSDTNLSTGIFDIVMINNNQWFRLDHLQKERIIKYLNYRLTSLQGDKFNLDYILISAKALNKNFNSFVKYDREQMVGSIIKLSSVFGPPKKTVFITTGKLPLKLLDFNRDILNTLISSGCVLNGDPILYIKLDNNINNIQTFPNNHVLPKIKHVLEKRKDLKSKIFLCKNNIAFLEENNHESYV